MQEKNKIKIYLNPKTSNADGLCLELLQKLNSLEEIKEGAGIEIIAPRNPFLADIKLKSRVAKRLLELRVKFIVRIDTV